MEKTKLELQIYGSPLLRKKCKPLEHIDLRVRDTLDRMLEMMRKNNGVGLAANQAGIDKALVVIETQDKVYKMINPRISKQRGKFFFTEGCLSFPGLSLDISRAKQVWVNYQDPEGQKRNMKAERILAVILQHEIDHINGVVFIDRLSIWKRFFIWPKLKEIKKVYLSNEDRQIKA
jgi:peptide deformylase